MLLRTDPFRDLERLSQQFFGSQGTLAHPTMMPMDAWRDEGQFHIELDLPGVSAESIDVDVEQNILTVEARRDGPDDSRELTTAERPRGVFRRQLSLGQGLDASRIQATYQNGVLSLTIPVAEQAKPRKVAVQPGAGQNQTAINA